MSDTPAPLPRRTFLKTTLLGSLLAVGAGAGLAFRSSPLRRHGPLKALTPDEHAVLSALVEVVCPGKPGVFPSADEVDLVGNIDTFLAGNDTEHNEAVKMALKVFDSALTGALVGERINTFASLSAEERSRVVVAWRDSSVGFQRTVEHGLSALVQSVYWGDPRVMAGVGYVDPSPAKLRETYADNLVDLRALRATTKPTES